MYISSNNGNYECYTIDEMKGYILQCAENVFDEIWISKDKNNCPILVVLINDNHACLHFFIDDKGTVFQSIGYGYEDMSFKLNNDEIIMPANSIILLDDAIKCAEQFFIDYDKPNCIKWRSL